MPSRNRPTRALLCLAAAAALVPAAGSAGSAPPPRETVLKQIRLPHNYYYREMYLPQATSGPGSFDWSPDGREVIVSMQGSLWRHRLGSTESVQITDGPGYDYQPDWSPDGTTVVYASYRDDAVDLMALDLETGAERTLHANGAVNVEPRFSPDGRRIAYVSTAHEGRFHLHVIPYDEGRAGEPERLSEDRDDHLPRYYYSRFDHALSPTWSPDGEELIFVSNRGEIWGSGGLWRARARPGARMRLVRDEETTWKARPDWSPDGRRVVYSSYLGRSWHQLWIMTDEGGEPFPLTYGDFDATNARWSPDGRRIGYISNQEGNTSLRIMDLPGGRTARVDPGRRRPLHPSGLLRISLTDKVTGRPLAARVSVMGPDGRFFAPDDAWRHADEAFVRGESRFEYGYFHARGSAALTVPAGRYQVEVSRGPDYAVDRRPVEVAAGGTATLRVSLARLASLQSQGWRSGDLHVHMNYGGTYRNDPRNLAFQAEAEGLDLVENLVVNKEQRIPDIAYFSTRPDPASTRSVLILHGQEFHTSYWGHTGLLGLKDHFLLPDYSSYVNTAAASAYPHNAAVFDLAHAQGALTGYVHPFDTRPDPFNEDEPLSYELPVDVALGKTDYFEVMGFSDHLITSEIWYRLLNCGFRLPAGAGTDVMANFASLRGPVGLVRVYVKTGPVFDHERFLAGLKAGRTFVTNAPILEFTLQGKEPGDTLRLPAGRRSLEARATLRSPVPLDHVEIVGNGKVVATIPLRADRRGAQGTARIDVERSGWYLLRAYADGPARPILDLYPFGSTSPVYVEVDGARARSPEDAAYFVKWTDRLIRSAGARDDWNVPGERDAVMKTLEEARSIFSVMAEGGRTP